MRISDWSSDVCSSDLQVGIVAAIEPVVGAPAAQPFLVADHPIRAAAADEHVRLPAAEQRVRARLAPEQILAITACEPIFARIASDVVIAVEPAQRVAARAADDRVGERVAIRSEEHTSELQSLMRISYAVFCLKTTNKNKPTTSSS